MCTLVTLPPCSVWAAFASLNLDERAVTLRRLAKFSECGTMGGHLILRRADCYLLPSRSICWDVSRLSGFLLSLVGLTFFWSAERTCTALAFQTFRRAAACAVGDIHYLGHSYRAYADLTRAILLTVSVAPWRGIAPRLCPRLINATSSDADAVLFVRRHSYGCTLLFDTGAVILPRPVPLSSLK